MRDSVNGTPLTLQIVLAQSPAPLRHHELDDVPPGVGVVAPPGCDSRISVYDPPVWDMDRVHDLINPFTTAFLLATLKSDTDAAAALAPEQVLSPGIQYQTTGF